MKAFLKKHTNRLLIALILCICAAGIFVNLNRDCWPVPKMDTEGGSQGFRIWQGDTLKSFDHRGQPLCIPDGWEAVGAEEVREGVAVFELGKTGVILKKDAFLTQVLEPKNSSYTVTVLYPTGSSADATTRYLSIVENAFSRVGPLFGDLGKDRIHKHTVVVTALLAGDTVAQGTRVYPDPGSRVSYLVRTGEQPRSEELLIHAVAHLYNRHRTDLHAYQKNQEPYEAEDWQEAEATWAEVAFLPKEEDRTLRLAYLTNIYTAQRSGNPSLANTSPFNNKEEFEKIRPDVTLPENPTYLEEQFGHYIMSPLVMLAVEGLLQSEKTKTDVETLLTEIHADPSINFIEKLKEILGEARAKEVESWLHGEETIPNDLIQAGVEYYNKSGR